MCYMLWRECFWVSFLLAVHLLLALNQNMRLQLQFQSIPFFNSKPYLCQLRSQLSDLLRLIELLMSLMHRHFILKHVDTRVRCSLSFESIRKQFQPRMQRVQFWMHNLLGRNELSVSLLYIACLFPGIYDFLHRNMQSRAIFRLPAKPIVSELRFFLFHLLRPL